MAMSPRPSVRIKWIAALGSAFLAIGMTMLSSPEASASPPTRASIAAAPNISPALASIPGTYVALTPTRILDTRSGLGGHGRLGANASIDVQVTGAPGVPSSGIGAVILNVTVTQATAKGYITVFPSHLARPLASNLDYSGPTSTSNLVIVPVGSDGKVTMFNGSGGAAQLIADVQGIIRSGGVSAPGSYKSLSPSRILDTRSNLGHTGSVAPGGVVSLQVTGHGGVPVSGVSAVAVNVTVTAPGSSGHITVYPAGITAPVVSNLNYLPGQTIPNLVIVPLGAGGKINLLNSSTGGVHLLADVQGYVLSGAPTQTGTFKALNPARIMDTRIGLGGSHRVAAGAETKLHVAGFGGVPGNGVSAVVVNLTAVTPSAFGNLVAFPTGVVKPVTSNLNFNAGQTKPSLAVVPVDEYGWISLTNNSTGSVDEIADVAGYFLGTGIIPTVIGPYSYGPFTIGMTAAQAKVVYPLLALPSKIACTRVDTTGANLLFNSGTTKLSFIDPNTPVQSANGIKIGDTINSVTSRFPWTNVSPDDPALASAVSAAENAKPGEHTIYWMDVTGPRGTFDVPLGQDKVTHISLELDEECFD